MIIPHASRLTFFALSAFIPLSPATAQRAVSKPPTFTTSTQMVLVPFSVTDHDGRSVLGLQSKDFNLLQDQAAQQIVSFSTEDIASSISLVLDISGSMQAALGAVKDASQDFVRTANPQDQFLLLTVSTQPAVAPEFTSDTSELQEKIADTKSGGFTSLIDTVYLGLNHMRKAPQPQRAMIVLSDGVDNHSRYSKSELLRVALEADVQIYSIIVDNGATGGSSNGVPYIPTMAAKPWDQARLRQGPDLLEALADKTGGLYFHVGNGRQAKDAIAKAGQALRNQYVIGYQPSDPGLSGKWHRIQVKTTVPKVHVHARNGYYAP